MNSTVRQSGKKAIFVVNEDRLDTLKQNWI